ncbi:translation initiation factor IF-2 [Bacteroidota bacterium]|nr:translation initiation factor IF-2 [Bacteroidota bacterium]
MSETTTGEKRIAAVARELNVGLNHLIDHLNAKGFKVENKPTTKITNEMYEALLREFQKDKTEKIQADKISLGIKAATVPAKDKTEEKEVRAAQISKEKEDQAEEVLIKNSKTATTKPAEKKKTEEPVAEKKVEKAPEKVIEKPVEKVADKKIEKVAEKPTDKKAEKVNEEEKPAEKIIKRGKADKVEGPKIIGKIELPVELPPDDRGKKKAAPKVAAKKGKKKEEAPIVEDVKPVEPPVAESPKPETPPTKESPAEPTADTPDSNTPEDPNQPTRKTQFSVLSGPVIMGKIDLGSVKDKKPDYSDIIKGDREKRKRKRIYSSEQGPTNKPAPSASGGGTGTAPPPKPGERRPFTPPTSQPPRRDNNRGTDNNRGGSDRGRSDRNRGAKPPDVPQEVSQKEIQDKIKATLSRLGQHGVKGGKGAKTKLRKLKREVAAEEMGSEDGAKKIQLTEFISVSELASLLNVSVTDVIKNCMNLGIFVSINQRLDAEIIELVTHEFGFEAEFIGVEAQEEQEEFVDEPEDLKPRPPIVTIMGHVDHGKTSLLDYIRSANVVAGEKGGITQHIGAYEVELADKRKITFLDTPGHEAFTAMRARGAKITDIVVIVIAADDSVMPQTKEAISHAQAAGVPMIFAFNKMDKPGADAEKVRSQLANMNILVEDWGGKFQSQEISAKSGTNVQLLLEKILIEADVLELKANPDKPAIGSVIEASLDKGRGYVSTVLVQEGTLRHGDIIVAGANSGRVKAMYDERGNKITVAPPATPVLVLGLDGAPQAGEKVRAFEDEQEAKQVATKRSQILREQGIRTKKHITLDEIGRRLALGNFKELNVIIKADFDGSVEALTDSLQKLSVAEVHVNVVYRAVGQITESDVLLASASDAIIIGFQVRPSLQARKLAEKENIEIRLYSIIYDAIEEIKGAMEGMLEPKVEERAVCNVEVRDVFKIPKVGAVAGCFVTDGKINRHNKIHIVRDGIVIFTGELGSLKRFKDDVKDVATGFECGITIKNYNDIKTGDVIEGYEEVEVKRTL